METGYLTTENYGFAEPRLAMHLARDGNYGLFPAAGSSVVIIDADDMNRLTELGALAAFPKTFTAESGSSAPDHPKQHLYVEIEGEPPEGKHPFYDPGTGGHLGEWYAQSPDGGKGFVVGPGSIHPNGKPYRVVVDAPIARIPRATWEWFLSAVKTGSRVNHDDSPPCNPSAPDKSLGAALGLQITDIWPIPTGASRSGDNYLFAHPVHGSESGRNLSVNPSTGVWYCHRCRSGGDALLALAVNEGIIDCAGAGAGALADPELMAEVTEAARQRGYDVDGVDLDLPDGASREGAAPTPTILESHGDPSLDEEARAILETGDPFTFMVNTYNLDHVGDVVLGQCCTLSLASRLVRNSFGLHVLATGESGKGKTDGFRTMLLQVPSSFRFDGSFSDRSLYYFGAAGLLQPASVFVIDDKDLSDTLQEVLKEATSDFRRPINHRTLTTDRKPVVCTIPERCIWWVAKVHGVGDDQVWNRMLVCWVDDSMEQDQRVLEAVLEMEARDDDTAEERREVAIARALWEQLQGQGIIHVSLAPLARRIRFGSSRNRRNPRMFLDMVKAVARVRAFQREPCTLPNGTVGIKATETDYKTAAAIFEALHGPSGGQETKMTNRETRILDAIVRSGRDRFDIRTLQALTQLTYDSIYQALNGYPSRGRTYAGLVEKCPALSLIEGSVSIREPDDVDARKSKTTGRRVKVWSFDRGIYDSWKTKAVVWLDPVPEGTGGIAECCGTVTEPSVNEMGVAVASISDSEGGEWL